MQKNDRTGTIRDIDFRIVYSRRRTLGISVLPDCTVIVRVPYRTSDKTISRIVNEKADWIIKHRNNYKFQYNNKLTRLYSNGETHLFRGNEVCLKIVKSDKSFIRFQNGIIEMGLPDHENSDSVRKLLYMGYRNEAMVVFPEMVENALLKCETQKFKPTGLKIRSMKRRWGSCSNKGIITLSTELIKLPDIYIEYVIIHELCHLKHHNHGSKYYELLTELFPDWKTTRKELRSYIR